MPRRTVRRRVSRRGGVRRRSYKSTRFSRRSAKNRFRSARRQAAARKARFAGRIERALNVETKALGGSYVATAWSNSSTGTLHAFINDSLAGTGTTSFIRYIGNQFTLKGLMFQIYFVPGSTQTITIPLTFALVRSRNDVRTTNVDPSVYDIFDNNSVALTAPPSTWVRRGVNMAGYSGTVAQASAGSLSNHRVLFVKRVMVHVAATQTAGYKPYRKYVLRFNHRVVCNNAEALGTTKCSPDYSLMGWSDAAAGTGCPDVIVNYKMIYTDF